MKRSLAWCSARVAFAAVAGLVAWRPIAAAVLSGVVANVSRAHADSSRTTFERGGSHVSIASSGHVDLRDPPLSFDFFADVDFGPNRRASGGMQFVFADGSVKFYAPVVGTRLDQHQCLVFFLGGIPSGALDPTDTAVAVVRDDPERPGVIWVKLQLKQSFPQTLHFEVPGEIRPIRTGALPQANRWFSLFYRPQHVTIEGTDMVGSFAAWASVRRDHRANGFVVLRLPDARSPLRFEPVFATVVPETATGPGFIVILMALDGAPLQIENLAIATVHADPDVPGCDIWDFTSNAGANGGSPFHIVFHAEGKSRVVPGGWATRGPR